MHTHHILNCFQLVDKIDQINLMETDSFGCYSETLKYGLEGYVFANFPSSVLISGMFREQARFYLWIYVYAPAHSHTQFILYK